MKISAHFDSKEFECQCGCGLSDMNPLLIDGLEKLRSVIGNKPIIVTSGRRCEKHNAETPNASKNSQHVKGNAADIKVAGMSPEELREAAYKVPQFKDGGIGIYNWGIHVDVRGKRARWDYR